MNQIVFLLPSLLASFATSSYGTKVVPLTDDRDVLDSNVYQDSDSSNNKSNADSSDSFLLGEYFEIDQKRADDVDTPWKADHPNNDMKKSIKLRGNVDLKKNLPHSETPSTETAAQEWDDFIDFALRGRRMPVQKVRDFMRFVSRKMTVQQWNDLSDLVKFKHLYYYGKDMGPVAKKLSPEFNEMFIRFQTNKLVKQFLYHKYPEVIIQKVLENLENHLSDDVGGKIKNETLFQLEAQKKRKKGMEQFHEQIMMNESKPQEGGYKPRASLQM